MLSMNYRRTNWDYSKIQMNKIDRPVLEKSILTCQKISVFYKRMLSDFLPMLYVVLAAWYRSSTIGLVSVDGDVSDYIAFGFDIFAYSIVFLICFYPVRSIIRKYLLINEFVLTGLLLIRSKMIDNQISREDVDMFQKLILANEAKKLMHTMSNGNN